MNAILAVGFILFCQTLRVYGIEGKGRKIKINIVSTVISDYRDVMGLTDKKQEALQALDLGIENLAEAQKLVDEQAAPLGRESFSFAPVLQRYLEAKKKVQELSSECKTIDLLTAIGVELKKATAEFEVDNLSGSRAKLTSLDEDN